MYVPISEYIEPHQAAEMHAMRYDQRLSGLGMGSSLESSSRSFSSHHLAELPPGVTCEKETILDRFEVGQYQLRPHHYERLYDFSAYVESRHKAGAAADLYVLIEGHADGTGSQITNAGLSFMRALEVKTHLSEWLSKKGIPVPIKYGSWAATRLIPGSSRQRNRRVEVRLCRGLPTS